MQEGRLWDRVQDLLQYILFHLILFHILFLASSNLFVLFSLIFLRNVCWQKYSRWLKMLLIDISLWLKMIMTEMLSPKRYLCRYNFWPKRYIFNSQLLNIKILKFNSSVLLNQLGNIFPYCPVDRAIRRINYSNIDLLEGQ